MIARNLAKCEWNHEAKIPLSRRIWTVWTPLRSTTYTKMQYESAGLRKPELREEFIPTSREPAKGGRAVKWG